MGVGGRQSASIWPAMGGTDGVRARVRVWPVGGPSRGQRKRGRVAVTAAERRQDERGTTWEGASRADTGATLDLTRSHRRADLTRAALT